MNVKKNLRINMKIIENNIKDILKKEIVIKMTISDFLSMYVAKMTCPPDEFKEYVKEMFPEIENKNYNLFTDSVETEEMEEIIDFIKFPHKDWLCL